MANLLFHLVTEENLEQVLRAAPELIGDAWDEATRLSPANLGLFRSPKEDVEIEGNVFPAGVNFLTLYAAGNQDPNVFSDPQ